MCFWPPPSRNISPAWPSTCSPTSTPVLLLVAPALRGGHARHGGAARRQVTYRKTADEVASSHKTLLEYTLEPHPARPQGGQGPDLYPERFNPMHRLLKQVKALEAALKGEGEMHRSSCGTKEGAFNCSGLQIIRCHHRRAPEPDHADFHRDHGVQINNPHVYIVEDGKQNTWTRPSVGMKRRFDPQGLLNPGKLRSWYTAEPQPLEAPVQTPVRQTA